MVGPPVAMPWIRLAPLVRLLLIGWLFQGGFVGSSSGFVGSSKWLHGADARSPSPLWKNPAKELIGGVRWPRRCHPATKELRLSVLVNNPILAPPRSPVPGGVFLWGVVNTAQPLRICP